MAWVWFFCFVIAVCLFVLSSVCSLTVWILNPAYFCETYYLNPTVKLNSYSKADFIAHCFALASKLLVLKRE